MAFQTIQEKINAEAKQNAERDWYQRCNKAAEILLSLCEGMTYEEKCKLIGSIKLGYDNASSIMNMNVSTDPNKPHMKPVRECCQPQYIRAYQEKATEAYMARIEKLEKRVEELSKQNESMISELESLQG